LPAKFTPDLLFNFRPIHERMSRLICIEKCCLRQKLAQTFDERAFSRGNSAGNPDCRHKKLSAVEAAVSAAKLRKANAAAANARPGCLVAAIDPFDFAQGRLSIANQAVW
jgi:hypothetical protein